MDTVTTHFIFSPDFCKEISQYHDWCSDWTDQPQPNIKLGDQINWVHEDLKFYPEGIENKEYNMSAFGSFNID
jgi:hypothetical protein